MACSDRWGRDIALTQERWIGHVVFQHPELRAHLTAVEATLTAPTWVMHDRMFGDRENYYRRGVLPPPHDHLMMKVVVAFAPTSVGDRVVGTVVTAFPIPEVTKGELRKWP